VEEDFPPEIGYQLIHRTASPLIEAERIGAKHAVMLVQEFRKRKESCKESRPFRDYQGFCEFLGCSGEEDGLSCAGVKGVNKDIHLYVGWVTCSVASPEQIARAASVSQVHHEDDDGDCSDSD